MKNPGPPLSGLLLLDKPLDLTSHDAVARVRRIFRQREVGHTGTLDPRATGLLVLALGGATRIARFVEAADKRYLATIRLGRATTTFDTEGETTAEAPVPADLDRARIEAALATLTGSIAQTVPAYSAVKVGGERLYAKARRGDAVEAPTRAVEIRTLDLTALRLPDLEIDTTVSKGTYVRSLAVQIGEALGLPAHLAALRRVSVGPHQVMGARTLDGLAGTQDELLPIEAALAHLPQVRLDAAGEIDVGHGRPLAAGPLLGGLAAGFAAGDALCLLDREGRARAVAFAEADRAILAAGPASARAIAYACVLSSVKPLTPRSQGS